MHPPTPPPTPHPSTPYTPPPTPHPSTPYTPPIHPSTPMLTPYEQLGISPTATPDEVRTAYHAKLKEFPAHSHPQEFKAIRAAYDAIRKGEVNKVEDFMEVRPLEATVDPDAVQRLREKAIAILEVTVDDMIRATF